MFKKLRAKWRERRNLKRIVLEPYPAKQENMIVNNLCIWVNKLLFLRIDVERIISALEKCLKKTKEARNNLQSKRR
jgi:hypothetical protein